MWREVGHHDPCQCGSGKKHTKCLRDVATEAHSLSHATRRTAAVR
jgi:uncharacterized protein YecA (UPF0149 family)